MDLHNIVENFTVFDHAAAVYDLGEKICIPIALFVFHRSFRKRRKKDEKPKVSPHIYPSHRPNPVRKR